MHPKQFHHLIIRPVLASMDMGGLAAEQLVLGTAITESNLEWLRQMGGGPALGLFQMEPATHDDLWVNYLARKPGLRALVLPWVAIPHGSAQMVWNLAYATVMCRLHYCRRPEPLPEAGDAMGLARYHKAYYNTAAGKADPGQSVIHFERAIALVSS